MINLIIAIGNNSTNITLPGWSIDSNCDRSLFYSICQGADTTFFYLSLTINLERSFSTILIVTFTSISCSWIRRFCTNSIFYKYFKTIKEIWVDAINILLIGWISKFSYGNFTSWFNTIINSRPYGWTHWTLIVYWREIRSPIGIIWVIWVFIRINFYIL